ncbi:MAG: hypothetical protein EU550_01365 [Promethearchaeota archaeon]|nr:MAG: hypothetical protein EU550_01365 [Candidatus Lokiarchaeota archaeon]
MSDSSDTDKSIKKYIRNKIENTIKTKKLSLINENIIDTLDLGKREKITITLAQKIISKNNVGFFYLTEVTDKITKKYKIKENPTGYIISLYQEGIIIPYKRETSLLFTPAPSIADTESFNTQNSLNKINVVEENKSNKAQNIEKNIRNGKNNVDLGSSGRKMDKKIGEKTLEPINIPKNKKIASEIKKIKITDMEDAPKPPENNINKTRSKSLLGVKLEEHSAKPMEEEISKKKKYTKENIEGLIKLRKEHLNKTQELVNHFNFLDSLAELEAVIEISEVMGHEKAVKLYRKQSENILELGLKYEEIIDNVKQDQEYRKKVEKMLAKTVNDVKKFWKNKDHKNVYSSLKQAAKLSYYLENTDDAIIYSDQAEAMKHKINET